MTTIAYNHKDKQIAVDSRATLRGVCHDNTNKIHKHEGKTFILAGSVCDIDYFITNFDVLTIVDLKVELDICGIMIENGIAYYVFISCGVYNMEKLRNNLCLGSGEQFALSALDFDRTAKEAVEYAMTRDIYTGGKVTVINVDSE